jgi:mono/diheme cytochrome c family protein
MLRDTTLTETVDSQLTLTKPLIQRLTLFLLTILLLSSAIFLVIHFTGTVDPYAQEVLSLAGDSSRGNAIFQINCAQCHGFKADGNIGPCLHGIANRKSEVGLIYQVVSGQTPPMPKFQPSPQEMADLLTYLKNI